MRVSHFLRQPDAGKPGVLVLSVDKRMILVGRSLAEGGFLRLDNYVVDYPDIREDALVKLIVAYFDSDGLKRMRRDEHQPPVYFVPPGLPVGEI